MEKNKMNEKEIEKKLNEIGKKLNEIGKITLKDNILNSDREYIGLLIKEITKLEIELNQKLNKIKRENEN